MRKPQSEVTRCRNNLTSNKSQLLELEHDLQNYLSLLSLLSLFKQATDFTRSNFHLHDQMCLFLQEQLTIRENSFMTKNILKRKREQDYQKEVELMNALDKIDQRGKQEKRSREVSQIIGSNDN